MEVSDTLIAADLQSYCMWDVDIFYDNRVRLPERQRASMELCLFENVAERDAALKMGIAETNPVCVYATVGLTRLLSWAVRGELTGYPISLDQREIPQPESQPS